VSSGWGDVVDGMGSVTLEDGVGADEYFGTVPPSLPLVHDAETLAELILTNLPRFNEKVPRPTWRF